MRPSIGDVLKYKDDEKHFYIIIGRFNGGYGVRYKGQNISLNGNVYRIFEKELHMYDCLTENQYNLEILLNI